MVALGGFLLDLLFNFSGFGFDLAFFGSLVRGGRGTKEGVGTSAGMWHGEWWKVLVLRGFREDLFVIKLLG